MNNEKRSVTNENVERLTKLKAQCPETDEDPKKLSKMFEDDSEEEAEDQEQETEQSLEFLTGGERYIQD